VVNKLVQGVCDGNIQPWYFSIAVPYGDGNHLLATVQSGALRDNKGIVRMVTACDQYQIACELGCQLPTPRMMDTVVHLHERGVNKEGRLLLCDPIWGAALGMTEEEYSSKLPDDDFYFNPGKSWVITNRIMWHQRRDAYNYGQYAEVDVFTRDGVPSHHTVTPDMCCRVAQPLAAAHNIWHEDPSQVCGWLWARECAALYADGKQHKYDIRELLTGEAKLNRDCDSGIIDILSHEGHIHEEAMTRYA
jgi:hypothetical protein